MTEKNRFRLINLLVVVLLFGLTSLVLAQEGEPLTNPECTADQIGDELEQIEQYYADAQTALQDGDVRGWLSSLQSISQLTSSLQAFCDSYVFEGDAVGSRSQVIGPVTFQPGIYTVTVTTAGFFSMRVEPVSEECDFFGMVFSDGDATEGAQEVYRIEDEPCTVLLEISNLTEDWRVEFSALETSSSSFDAAEYAAALNDELLDSEIEIVEVRVIDADDGITATISFESEASSGDDLQGEVFDILTGVAQAVRSNDLDLYGVLLIIADSNGDVAGFVSVEVVDVLAWFDGDLTDAEFLARLETTDF